MAMRLILCMVPQSETVKVFALQTLMFIRWPVP